MCLYSIQRLDSRTMFLNVFLVFLQNCLTDTRGILGYNRKAPRVEEKKYFFVSPKTHKHLFITTGASQ